VAALYLYMSTEDHMLCEWSSHLLLDKSVCVEWVKQ